MIKALDALFLDIETTCTVDPAVIERLSAKIKPPGNISKAETIAKWEADSRPAAVAEAVSRTALSGSYGRIVAIGHAVADGPVTVSVSQSEAELLRSLFALDVDHGCFPKLVGHNLTGFDLPFIRQRCIVLGVKLPYWFPRDIKPWSTNLCDTQVAWAGVRDYISLTELAAVLGIEVSPTISGADVPGAFQAGDLEAIVAHCREDVRVTREVYRKISAVL